MKKLLGLIVVLAVLLVCAPSYGYILVYKVTGSMKAAEWNVDKIIGVSVKGYIAVSIVSNVNGDNEISDAQMVIYGKNKSGGLVYYRDYLNDANSGVNLYTPGYNGSVVEVQVWNHTYAPMYYEFVITGTAKAADVGFGVGSKELAASSLKGSLVTWWAQLLDNSQELYGSGSASATLDAKQTKAANVGSLSVGTIISDFIDTLIAKHYNQLAVPG